MKKILSLILCGLFFNMMLCPSVFALEEVTTADSGTDTAATEVISDNPDVNVSKSQTDSANTQTEDVSTQQTAGANTQTADVTAQPYTERTEHLSVRKNNSKKIDVESVYISSHGVEIPAQDILQVAFVNDFNGRRARIGDTIEFRFPNDIVTQEGTMIIPSTARIIAEITNLKKPKPLHLSGKVYLTFKYIEVNGVRKPIEARVYGKKDFLSRKTLNKTTAVGETAVMTGAGAVAGATICAATATNVAVIVFGSALTAGAGAIAGVTLGILLPGASFKAKAGQRVNIELTEGLDI